VSVSAGPEVEIACDESGSEGEKLIGGTTDVFAHASVCMDTDAAASCIVELRGWTRSPAEEYKASVVLRSQNRRALTWLLGPSGPLHTHAHVHLTEKSFFLVGAAVDFLGGDGTGWPDRPPGGVAAFLHAEAARTFGRGRWEAFLGGFNDLLRARGRVEVESCATAFAALLEDLRRAGRGTHAGDVLDRSATGAADLGSLLAPLVDTSRMAPRLQPLVPALLRAVGHWGAGGRAVSIVHDEQHALTAQRIAYVKALLDGTGSAGHLVDLRLVDSRSDARVQVADLLAGAARRIAEDELNGKGDAELIDLLAPYVDRGSIWARTGGSRLAAMLDPTA
jgi:hypothetical protein